jgi:hypothetical protein
MWAWYPSRGGVFQVSSAELSPPSPAGAWN